MKESTEKRISVGFSSSEIGQKTDTSKRFWGFFGVSIA